MAGFSSPCRSCWVLVLPEGCRGGVEEVLSVPRVRELGSTSNMLLSCDGLGESLDLEVVRASEEDAGDDLPRGPLYPAATIASNVAIDIRD